MGLQAQSSQRLEEVFRGVFELGASDDVRRLAQGGHPKWDSLGHMLLIAAIESEFGVSIDTADALEMKSFEAAQRWLDGNGS